MRGGQDKTSGGAGSNKFTIYSCLCLFILLIKQVTCIYVSVVRIIFAGLKVSKFTSGHHILYLQDIPQAVSKASPSGEWKCRHEWQDI